MQPVYVLAVHPARVLLWYSNYYVLFYIGNVMK